MHTGLQHPNADAHPGSTGIQTIALNDAITIAIIWGGAAGPFCALRAAGEGRKVTLLEKKPGPGRKILLAGSGQCNNHPRW